jgi:hypothetical protein
METVWKLNGSSIDESSSKNVGEDSLFTSLLYIPSTTTAFTRDVYACVLLPAMNIYLLLLERYRVESSRQRERVVLDTTIVVM